MKTPATGNERRPTQLCRTTAEDHESEAAWQMSLAIAGTPNAERISESICGSGQRVYGTADLVVKIRLKNIPASGDNEYGNLKQEFDVVERLGGISYLPRAVTYGSSDTLEYAVYKRIGGTPLTTSRLLLHEELLVLVKLARLLFKISCRGVAHNDVHRGNVLVGPCYAVYLIDFDRATQESMPNAFARNFLRVFRCDAEGFYFSFHSIAVPVVWKAFGSWYVPVEIALKKAADCLARRLPWEAMNYALRAVLSAPLKFAAWSVLVKAVWSCSLDALRRCLNRSK